MITIDALLASSGLPAAESRLLLCHALGLDRAWIVAHGRDSIGEDWARKGEALFARRRAGEPVAYLTGEREFYGLSLHVTPAVLIPRPETELLVERALALLAPRAAPRVLDLATGSGAIAVAIAHARSDAEVWATDASDAALAVARENATRHSARVRFVRSDWFEALAGERFDLIASNPPYVAQGDPHLREGDLRFEPIAALVAGADGLECIRRIAVEAREHLVPGGWLVLEHGYDQGPQCTRLLDEAAYADVLDLRDLAGLPRVCEGRFDAPRRAG